MNARDAANTQIDREKESERISKQRQAEKKLYSEPKEIVKLEHGKA